MLVFQFKQFRLAWVILKVLEINQTKKKKTHKTYL